MTLPEESPARPPPPSPDSSPTTAELEKELTDINAQILSATAAQVAASRLLGQLRPQGVDGGSDDVEISTLRERLGALDERIAALRAASAEARAAYDRTVRPQE